MALKLYPALDLLNGECVRLSQGRFDAKTVYSANPLEVATRFQAQGAKALHIVDLQGAKDPKARQTKLLRELLSHFPTGEMETQVGGGVRSLADAASLIELGATRVVIGSLAVQNVRETEEIFRVLGRDRVTLALDLNIAATGELRVAVHGWQEASLLTLDQVMASYCNVGVRHLLCTDISRDGMLSGPNLPLYQQLAANYQDVEIQASGGMRNVADVRALAEAGIHAAILGRSLYQGTIDLKEALAAC